MSVRKFAPRCETKLHFTGVWICEYNFPAKKVRGWGHFFQVI
ncbi:MAG: hypothetical protein ACJ8EF_11485 [Bradyrhizobium sp.]|jgi:hypothetical protein